MLVKKGYLGKINLILDGGCAIVYAQKGILNLKVSITGKSAHGSTPWEGENANEKLMTAFAKIKKLFPAPSRHNRWVETVNLGIMQGGDTINKVPDRAWMGLNIRLTEKGDPQKIIKRIKKIKEVAKVEKLGYHRYYYCSPQDKIIQTYKKIMEKELKTKLPLEKMHGATDAHNFAGIKYPLIISGAGGGEGAHGAKERVKVKELLKFEQALINYIKTVV